ncbi:MAG: hypothetical protein VW877_01265 [Pseudomonadaceae bacterium]
MKHTHGIWLLCAVVLVSVFVNVMLTKANLDYSDEAYGQLAQQYQLNLDVLSQLEEGKVDAAKALLYQEVEAKGPVLALCMMEGCSSRAEQILQGVGGASPMGLSADVPLR